MPKFPPNPRLTQSQAFALAIGAPLNEFNGYSHEWLFGAPPGGEAEELGRFLLERDWSVTSRQSTLSTLRWLGQEGHGAEYVALREHLLSLPEVPEDPLELLSGEALAQMDDEARAAFCTQLENVCLLGDEHPHLLGWDLVRALSVCRWAAAAGYLSEAEAWPLMLGYASTLQASFESWRALGENYIAGRRFWSGDSDPKFDSVIEALLDPHYAASPWNRIPWHTPLRQLDFFPQASDQRH